MHRYVGLDVHAAARRWRWWARRGGGCGRFHRGGWWRCYTAKSASVLLSSSRGEHGALPSRDATIRRAGRHLPPFGIMPHGCRDTRPLCIAAAERALANLTVRPRFEPA